MITDPIADMLTRIRNGYFARLSAVSAPHSKLKMELLRVLKKNGYVADFSATEDGRDIKIGVNPGLLAMMEQTIPLGRGGTPEEAAGAVFLFCIPESDYVSGQTLICSGGLTGI